MEEYELAAMFEKILAEEVNCKEFIDWVKRAERVSYNIGHDDGEAYQRECVDFQRRA